LPRAQLSCLARLLSAKNLTADFGRFPPDLLLFFDSAEVPPGTCREFYARASRGNLDLLPRGSSRRTGLLRGARTCLGVRSSRLEPGQLGSLGALVCDMEPESIPASHPGILENLKLCPALTGAQRDALNAVLLTGGTEYGDPSSWDLQTLKDLGPLVLALNQTTLSLVAKAAREEFSRSIAVTYGSQGHSQREKSPTLLRAFAAASASSHARLKRSTERCESKPITTNTITTNPFSLLDYSTEQFNLCLSNDILIENLEVLLEQPLPSQYSQIMKEKVDQFYPEGMPEGQLRRLGSLSRLYTEQEISRWPVTSSDTLLALLDPSGGDWDDSQAQQLISRYLALGGILTGPLLQEIGGRRLCKLQEEQVEQIPAEAIGAARQLNISSCSQPKKEQLYRKAQVAFAGLASTPSTYYCQIRPYLGGAPAKDLKDLANTGVAIDMDMETFLALNPEELQKLSVTDVKNLLGKNLPELKKAEKEPLVMGWVERQSQRELDCVLDIGLQGGMEDTGTTTPAHPTTPAGATSMATNPVPTTLPTITTPPHPTTPAAVTSTATTPVPTTLPTVPTSPHSTTPAGVTSTVTVPTSSHPTTPTSV
ncbi:MSLNL protein, partial [Scytalopus superciliaris]|nr:MSLNL protein [Scytalopus superciliaris]